MKPPVALRASRRTLSKSALTHRRPRASTSLSLSCFRISPLTARVNCPTKSLYPELSVWRNITARAHGIPTLRTPGLRNICNPTSSRVRCKTKKTIAAQEHARARTSSLRNTQTHVGAEGHYSVSATWQFDVCPMRVLFWFSGCPRLLQFLLWKPPPPMRWGSVVMFLAQSAGHSPHKSLPWHSCCWWWWW